MLSEAGRPIVFMLYVYLSVCLSVCLTVCLTVCAKNEEKHMVINQCNSKLLDFGDIRPVTLRAIFVFLIRKLPII